MKEQKEIYVVLDENNVIQKFLTRTIIFENGKSTWNIIKKNFDESKDFENAVVIDSQYLDKIHVGYSQVIYGTFVENAEQYELSLKQGV